MSCLGAKRTCSSHQSMSAFGTKRTYRVAPHMSAFGGKADHTSKINHLADKIALGVISGVTVSAFCGTSGLAFALGTLGRVIH